MSPKDEAKVRSKIIDDGGCWRWDTQAKTTHNRRHPAILLDGKMHLVRRVVYELERGELRPNIFLAPTCGDECCIHPEHQKQLTRAQKNLMGAKLGAAAPGRNAKVSAHVRESGRAKLSLDIAREIRGSNEPMKILAERYGVHQKAIWDVRRNRTWKDYRNPFGGLML